MDAFNMKVTSNYQIDTADRFGRMEHIVDDRADIHAKMCAVVKNSHDHVRIPSEKRNDFAVLQSEISLSLILFLKSFFLLQVVKKTENFGQKTVEDLAKASGDVNLICIQIGRGYVLARTVGVGLFALQGFLHDLRWEAAGRLTKVAAQHVDHAVGEGHVFLRVLNLFAGQTLRHHHQRHIAHNF